MTRFDVFQQTSRPNHFTVVEIWRDQNAYDAHITSAHTKRFREQLTPMSGALPTNGCIGHCKRPAIKPVREQRLGTAAVFGGEQEAEVLGRVDVERNAREPQHNRIDAARPGLREMGKEAVVSKPQRHHVGGGAQHRVRCPSRAGTIIKLREPSLAAPRAPGRHAISSDCTSGISAGNVSMSRPSPARRRAAAATAAVWPRLRLARKPLPHGAARSRPPPGPP